MHLAAKHFVEGVSPTSSSTLLNKVKAALANATSEDDEVDVAALNNELEGLGFDSEETIKWFVEGGFKEGTAMTFDQLDKVLASE